jgi:hypothetical protein
MRWPSTSTATRSSSSPVTGSPFGGKVVFLQLVGVTAERKERMLETSTEEVLDEQRAVPPLLVLQP